MSDASTNPDPKPANGNGHHHTPPGQAVNRLGDLFGEYKEYLSYYVSAKTDSIKASVRNAVIYAALGVLGLFAGVAVVVTATVLLLVGIAELIGSLTHRMWIGNLAVGLLILGGIGLGAWIVLSKLSKSFHSSTVKKYEQRQNWQRGQYGRNVNDAASQAQ